MKEEFTPEEQRRLAVINRAQEHFESLEDSIKWAKTPNKSLNNETPFYLAKQGDEGLQRVLDLLEKMQILMDCFVI